MGSLEIPGKSSLVHTRGFSMSVLQFSDISEVSTALLSSHTVYMELIQSQKTAHTSHFSHKWGAQATHIAQPTTDSGVPMASLSFTNLLEL